MTTLLQHPHAAFDRFPQLVRELESEFGREGLSAIIERFIEAERADFYWESRIAEWPLGVSSDPLEDADEEACEQVAILGYFRGRYHIAICLVDAERCVRWMIRSRHFDDFASAEAAFAAGG